MNFCLAHVNVARNYRGGERQTELLIRELEKRGVRQVLVARRDEPLSRRFQGVDIELRAVSGQLPGVVAATRGVDLLHVHEGRSVYAAYVRRLLSATPYILTRRVDNPIKNHFLAHRAYRSAFSVAAVAPKIADIVRAFDPAIETCVIHSGTSGLKPNAASVESIRQAYSGKFLVGNVAALDNVQKAQEHIVEVARKLEDSHPNLHFLLVGGGEDEAMLKESAAGLSNLTFTGFVDNVGDYLSAFDLFILPSRKEGIGGILLDAMEFELPVIATRVGGVPDIVSDGDNGVLIEAERPDQLEAAILALEADPPLRASMGRRGREVAKQYTAAVMAEKYVDLYTQALGPSARNSAQRQESKN